MNTGYLKKPKNLLRKLKKKKSFINLEDFAFESVKKLPLVSKRNVLSALNHFFNVKDVSDLDREVAFKKIVDKAKHYEICTMGFSKQYEDYKLTTSSKEFKS